MLQMETLSRFPEVSEGNLEILLDNSNPKKAKRRTFAVT